MNQKKRAKRDYNVSDGVLKKTADTIFHCAMRDVDHFASFSITPAVLSAFRISAAVFGDMVSDEELLGARMVATQGKEECAEKLRIAIRSVRAITLNAWGTEDARYRTFGFGSISRLPDVKLLRLGKNTLRLANEFSALLLHEGLTAVRIADLYALCGEFDEALSRVEDAVGDRLAVAEARIVAGNLLYWEMMRICTIGKDIWASVSEAHYNDFVIYETRPGSATGSLRGKAA
jgi:hypothetical protein